MHRYVPGPQVSEYSIKYKESVKVFFKCAQCSSLFLFRTKHASNKRILKMHLVFLR